MDKLGRYARRARRSSTRSSPWPPRGDATTCSAGADAKPPYPNLEAPRRQQRARRKRKATDRSDRCERRRNRRGRRQYRSEAGPRAANGPPARLVAAFIAGLAPTTALGMTAAVAGGVGLAFIPSGGPTGRWVRFPGPGNISYFQSPDVPGLLFRYTTADGKEETPGRSGSWGRISGSEDRSGVRPLGEDRRQGRTSHCHRRPPADQGRERKALSVTAGRAPRSERPRV